MNATTKKVETTVLAYSEDLGITLFKNDANSFSLLVCAKEKAVIVKMTGDQVKKMAASLVESVGGLVMLPEVAP